MKPGHSVRPSQASANLSRPSKARHFSFPEPKIDGQFKPSYPHRRINCRTKWGVPQFVCSAFYRYNNTTARFLKFSQRSTAWLLYPTNFPSSSSLHDLISRKLRPPLIRGPRTSTSFEHKQSPQSSNDSLSTRASAEELSSLGSICTIAGIEDCTAISRAVHTSLADCSPHIVHPTLSTGRILVHRPSLARERLRVS